MSRTRLIAVVTGLVAAVLAVPATPAHASSWRTARSSPSNADPVKAVAVTCPDGSVPYAGGGAVYYGGTGNGGAALTAIVPDVAARAVVVTAAAPAGQTADWALIGYAICSTFDLDPTVVVRSGPGTATATCDGDEALFGAGFHVAGDPAAGHVTGIDLNPDVTAVRVTAGGPGAATAPVTAIAVCLPAGLETKLVHARNDAAGWPKLVARQDNDAELKPYATGATVTGPDAATLDAVVPASDDGISWARGTLYGAAAAFAAKADGGDDDGSVSLETALIGTFH